MDCSYQGNALLKIGHETPQTTKATFVFKSRNLHSDSQGLIIALQASTVSLHPCCLGLSAGLCWSHRAVDVYADPILNPPHLFLSQCDTVRQLLIPLL